MGFREHLQGVCLDLEGAIACSLMGIDGIEVDTYLVAEASAGGDIDVKALLVEYSTVLRSAREAAEVNQAGGISELSIHTEKLAVVARLVSPEYFLVVALRPEGNCGKARYLLRITAPKVKAEL